MQEWGKQFILMRNKMSGHALCRPGPKVTLDILQGIARLGSERVAAEVDASWIGGVFLYSRRKL